MAKSTTHELSDSELLDGLSRHKQELLDLRFKHPTGSLENTSKIASHKREVARILTELRVREIAAAEAASKETTS